MAEPICEHGSQRRKCPHCELSDETQLRERFEEEVESTHKWLDQHGAPRASDGGEVFSLVGRITWLINS